MYQQFVARVVPLGVVHRLEVVQVNEHHRAAFGVAVRRGHRMSQAVAQQGAVGQLGEGVKVRQVADVLLRRPVGRDVVKRGGVVGDMAICVGDGRNALPFGNHLTVSSAVDHLALPTALGVDGGPHGLVKGPVVPA